MQATAAGIIIAFVAVVILQMTGALSGTSPKQMLARMAVAWFCAGLCLLAVISRSLPPTEDQLLESAMFAAGAVGIYYLARLLGSGLGNYARATMPNDRAVKITAAPAITPESTAKRDSFSFNVDRRRVVKALGMQWAPIAPFFLYGALRMNTRFYLWATACVLLVQAVTSLRFLVCSGPALLLQSDGIYTRLGLNCVKFVAWRDVVALKGVRDTGREYLGIELASPDLFLRGLPVLCRSVAKALIWRYGAPVCINVTQLQSSPADILLAAERVRLSNLK